MSLLDRHIAFVEALRAAGLPVSLAEDLDSVVSLGRIDLGNRATLHAALAATLAKRQSHRATFDAVFDLYYPPLVGAGARVPGDPEAELSAGETADGDAAHDAPSPQATEEQVAALRDLITEALLDQDASRLQALAVQGVQQFGSMPGRGPGLSAWSSYNTLQRLSPDILTLRLARALMAGGPDRDPRSEESSMTTATRRVDAFRRLVESDVRRRLAEERGAEYVAQQTLRPSIEQLSFTSARAEEIAEMRRQIYPLARRLATRLAKEQHARRRGPLDFRRTVRASMSTGGVPIVTHQRPKRPHRSELVVLCDVSGSVANFASFTLLLVYALREHFTKVRAFTFVDDVHEVTGELVAGRDPADTLRRLTDSARHASRWGRTNYGRAFDRFLEQHNDALTPKTSLLVLGDGRSNYTDPGLAALREMVGATRHAWWLNPEHPRQWGTGDSAAPRYAEVVPMVECRNLVQLGEFVHDLV